MDVLMTIVVSLIGGGLAGALANMWYQDHIKAQDRVQALKALRDEAKLNKAYALGNAIVAPNQFGPWIFFPLRSTACERVLLSGSVKVEDETREIGCKYLLQLDVGNTLFQRIHALQTVTSFRPDNELVMVGAALENCSATIEALLRHLESNYRDELGIPASLSQATTNAGPP